MHCHIRKFNIKHDNLPVALSSILKKGTDFGFTFLVFCNFFINERLFC